MAQRPVAAHSQDGTAVGAESAEGGAWAAALRERARPLVVGVATTARHYGSMTRAYTSEFDADAWFGIALAAGGATLAVQAYLVAARLSEDLAWHWTATLAPTWALNAAIAVFLFYYILVTVPEEASDAARAETRTIKLRTFAALATLSMSFACELMLAQRADGATHSFYAIAGPAYAGAGVVVAYGLYHLYVNWPEGVGAEGAGGTLPLYVGN